MCSIIYRQITITQNKTRKENFYSFRKKKKEKNSEFESTAAQHSSDCNWFLYVSLIILIIEKEHMHANIRILLFTYLFPTYAYQIKKQKARLQRINVLPRIT